MSTRETTHRPSGCGAIRLRSIAQWWFLQSASPLLGWSLKLTAKGIRCAASTSAMSEPGSRRRSPQAAHWRS